jgi:hypothetical protein
MAKIASGGAFTDRPKKTRPGVHSKTKTSRSKNSTNYKKRYKGQGK